MFQQWINWKNALILVAIAITSSTILYSHYLSQKLKNDERKKVEAWIEAEKTLIYATDKININLAAKISADNTDIPIIETDENNQPTGITKNIDSIELKSGVAFLQKQVKIFQQQNKPIEVVISNQPLTINKYFYGESKLQQQIRYYPIIQLCIIALFIVVLIVAQRISAQNTQNQLWAGMAKETAHQLGTPVSSLEGWVEILKEKFSNESFVTDIEKDVHRLLLVTDRFGKIGSTPHFEIRDIVSQVQSMMDYIKKRAGGNVEFILQQNHAYIKANISAPLFDWVIENLLKNALDAMEGSGRIEVILTEEINKIIITISDSGKGIQQKNWHKIFKPGFSTKQRGWGLGLTLTKRIVEEYHGGRIYILQSEINKGTTFCVELNK
jgi:signal transduction histidine kinase